MNIEREFKDIDSNDRWDDLYQHVRNSSNYSLSTSIAYLPHNRERNRYSNVLPYDYNRICLEKPLRLLNNRTDNYYNVSQDANKNNTTPDSTYKNHKIKCKWYKRNPYKPKNIRSTPNLNRKQNQNTDSNFNDYINASLVHFSCLPHSDSELSYILTQGPLPNTSSHFWLMVWQQNTHCIVMLNKIIERNSVKCHSYFPGSIPIEFDITSNIDDTIHSDTYDSKNIEFHKPRKKDNFIMELLDIGLQVIFLRRESKPNYIITVLELKELSTGECREIWHFQYTAWPDFGVPKDAETFLEFLDQINNSRTLPTSSNVCPSHIKHDPTNIRMTLTDPNLVNMDHGEDVAHGHSKCPDKCSNSPKPLLTPKCRAVNQAGPPIIHCSAGIGRTGTYCLVNSCIYQLREYASKRFAMIGSSDTQSLEDIPQIDIVSTLLHMRKFRAGLVQTSEQLKFAYAVLVLAVQKIFCPQAANVPEPVPDKGPEVFTNKDPYLPAVGPEPLPLTCQSPLAPMPSVPPPDTMHADFPRSSDPPPRAHTPPLTYMDEEDPFAMPANECSFDRRRPGGSGAGQGGDRNLCCTNLLRARIVLHDKPYLPPSGAADNGPPNVLHHPHTLPAHCPPPTTTTPRHENDLETAL